MMQKPLLSSVYRAPNHVAARQFGLTEMLNRAYNRLALRELFRSCALCLMQEEVFGAD
jgi:hypothetical protein